VQSNVLPVTGQIMVTQNQNLMWIW